MEELLIKIENEGRIVSVFILDSHKKHILNHLPFFWKKGMIKHIFNHFKNYKLAKKHGISNIRNSDILNHVKNPKKWE